MSNARPKRHDRPGVDRYGRTELHYAASEGDLERVSALLDDGADAGAADDRGFTPLHFAVQQDMLEAAAALLEAGAPVDAMTHGGNTPLWLAVFSSESGDTITLLRAHGADPRKPGPQGKSPLSIARQIANRDVARFFADLP